MPCLISDYNLVKQKKVKTNRDFLKIKSNAEVGVVLIFERGIYARVCVYATNSLLKNMRTT